MNFSKNNPPERLYLIGFMGSGKTFTGKKLAASLGWTFVDLDEKIESGAGLTIPEIFKKKGEAQFRQLEQAALRETFFLKKTVIATGGGTPCFFENMDEMRQKGYVIYLKTTQKLLFERLSERASHRPLIAEKSEKALRVFIKNTLRDRGQFYHRANLVLKPGKNGAETLGNLLKKLATIGLIQQ